MSTEVCTEQVTMKKPKTVKKKIEVPEVYVPKDPIEAYQGITLNFGKYSGKQLKDIADQDPKYLSWLRKRFSTNEDNQQLSPTQIAIVKYIKALNI